MTQAQTPDPTPPDYVTSPEKLLEDLDPQQTEVAAHQSGAMCVLAGAGTGKTRAIIYRIAYGVHSGQSDPNSILALSFTRKAAAEMRERLEGLGVAGVSTQTFHSAALGMARHFWPQVLGGEIPQITQHKSSLIVAAASRLHFQPSKDQVQELAAELEWAKVGLMTPDEYLVRARREGREQVGGLSTGRMADLMEAYEEAKLEREVLDFEDILLLTAGMMDTREDVLRAIRNRYHSFVVDEYQDVSPLQNYLLMGWLGHRRNLAVVGDAAQTIYTFTGATPSFLTDFTQVYPEAKVVQLVRDYRSTPQVVELANRVLSQAKGPDGQPLGGTVRLVSQKPDGAELQWFVAEDDQTEAREVARRVQAMHQAGRDFGDIALLYRVNSQAPLYQAELARLGIPSQVKENHRDAVPTAAKTASSAVTLSSLHSSKGLEWDAVFLVGLSQGLLPLYCATTPQQIEEERRLCYVGITRARDELTLSFARNRRAQKEDARRVTPFLEQFWPKLVPGRTRARHGT